MGLQDRQDRMTGFEATRRPAKTSLPGPQPLNPPTPACIKHLGVQVARGTCALHTCRGEIRGCVLPVYVFLQAQATGSGGFVVVAATYLPTPYLQAVAAAGNRRRPPGPAKGVPGLPHLGRHEGSKGLNATQE